MSDENGNYVVKYEMTSYQKDGTLHIELEQQFNDQRLKIAHWVASSKDAMIREYLISLGWTPPDLKPKWECTCPIPNCECYRNAGRL
jgi:hypothetical protein